MADQYIIIPGTQQKVYEGSVVMLHRLPNLRWILHNGYFNYNGRKQKGWYFSSIPSDTTMPVFNEDLVAMTVIDGGEEPGPGPFPPGPIPPPPPGPFPPCPPVPIPVPFTPQDKKQLDAAMITVENLTERDKLSRRGLTNGKVVRVNDIDSQGSVEYYSWNAETSTWEEASLGYRYMTRDEITDEIADTIVNITWLNDDGALVLTAKGGTSSTTELSGVTHDPVFDAESLTLTIPIFGKDDLVMTIPSDMYIRSIRLEKAYVFPDGSIKPAIVVVVSDGTAEHEIAGDASGFFTNGDDTDTAVVTVSDSTNTITVDVKISALANNRIEVRNDGLFVDVSDLENAISDLQNQVDIGPGDDGTVIVADGNGLSRAAQQIGGSTLSETDDDLLATEQAVKNALLWQIV